MERAMKGYHLPRAPFLVKAEETFYLLSSQIQY